MPGRIRFEKVVKVEVLGLSFDPLVWSPPKGHEDRRDGSGAHAADSVQRLADSMGKLLRRNKPFSGDHVIEIDPAVLSAVWTGERQPEGLRETAESFGGSRAQI